MNKAEYFGDWIRVLDSIYLDEALTLVGHSYKTKKPICPEQKDVFKAFQLCPYDNLRVVCLFQDPYPQLGVATGIALGNSVNTPENKLSPSLKVVKEAIINYDIPHNNITFDTVNNVFDCTLESWCKQGVLMLNSALTVEANKIGSHMGVWRPVIREMLRKLSKEKTGIVYVLFGRQAQSFKQYINGKSNHIIEVEHPAYFVRMQQKMPNVFNEVNDILIGLNGYGIEWYSEGREEQEDKECNSQ